MKYNTEITKNGQTFSIPTTAGHIFNAITADSRDGMLYITVSDFAAKHGFHERTVKTVFRQVSTDMPGIYNLEDNTLANLANLDIVRKEAEAKRKAEAEVEKTEEIATETETEETETEDEEIKEIEISARIETILSDKTEVEVYDEIPEWETADDYILHIEDETEDAYWHSHYTTDGINIESVSIYTWNNSMSMGTEMTARIYNPISDKYDDIDVSGDTIYGATKTLLEEIDSKKNSMRIEAEETAEALARQIIDAYGWLDEADYGDGEMPSLEEYAEMTINDGWWDECDEYRAIHEWADITYTDETEFVLQFVW